LPFCFVLFVSFFFQPLSTMLPTTHKMTSKTAQTAVKQAVATHNHLQKEHLLKTVNDVVLEYTTSTGKKKSTAQQEIFTIEHLS